MAFYYGDERLGETSAEAVERLDSGECRAVVYDYFSKNFTVEELASFILDRETTAAIYELAEEALENLSSWAESGMDFCYGGVECIKDDGSSNRRPKASQCRRGGTSGRKAPAKRTTKPKTSNARRPKAPAKATSGRR